ncbi:MAG: carbamoyl phosphate synthase small subunit [Acetivibrionales bacterium]|jgi:carbamoyl-phosphate synthase small subunit
MKAVLALEDGTMFHGESIGAQGTCIGEIVFSTGMTGYQEVLSDPSFVGQLVALTYPIVGNYGVNPENTESDKIHLKGFIVRELCNEPSNFRCQGTLDEYLKKNSIIGIQGIDTRALTRILRDKGTMNGIISTQSDFKLEDWFDKVKSHKLVNPVDMVTSKEVKHYEGAGKKVAIIDYGLKKSIVKCLQKRDCDIYVFPADTVADDILAVNPNGIVLSNGPGNPEDCSKQVEVIKGLLGKKPILGICLGHLLAARACGADTVKMKHGHHGGNYPVKDIIKDRTYITSQGHGYVVAPDSLDLSKAEISHVNINDGTVEGIKYLDTPTITVQFHPEASPGPNDTEFIFDRFIALMNEDSL